MATREASDSTVHTSDGRSCMASSAWLICGSSSALRQPRTLSPPWDDVRARRLHQEDVCQPPDHRFGAQLPRRHLGGHPLETRLEPLPRRALIAGDVDHRRQCGAEHVNSRTRGCAWTVPDDVRLTLGEQHEIAARDMDWLGQALDINPSSASGHHIKAGVTARSLKCVGACWVSAEDGGLRADGA